MLTSLTSLVGAKGGVAHPARTVIQLLYARLQIPTIFWPWAPSDAPRPSVGQGAMNPGEAAWQRDLDQVHADLRSAKRLSQYKNSKAAEDLPGLGQHYCVECAKWFESGHNLVRHRRGKNHLRRVRLLREAPYSQREAEAAIGLGVDNGPTRKAAVDPADEIPLDIERDVEVEPERVGGAE
ncbi:MAG: Bud site selection protein 20 [Geoglossum simile]|nr:MAG: Bud site selection protein 20 [Geoglossum simile]